MATISAKLAANVATVSVTRNQEVKAGDALVGLDDGDQRIALESAQAKSATAAATLSRIDAQTEAARASLLQAQAQATSAEAAVTRSLADFERAYFAEVMKSTNFDFKLAEERTGLSLQSLYRLLKKKGLRVKDLKNAEGVG
mgnify:CR=1 FL=1